MTYDDDQIRNKIDATIIDYMNGLPHLLGAHKRTVKLEDIYGKSRRREYTVCRQLSIYICNFVFNDILRKNFTREDVGDFYNKDHASVTHSIKTIKDYQDTTPQILTMTAYCMDAVLYWINRDFIDQSNPNWYTKFYHEHATI